MDESKKESENMTKKVCMNCGLITQASIKCRICGLYALEKLSDLGISSITKSGKI